MKRSKDYHYSEISSFEDLRLEKERLKLKSKLIGTKIKLDLIQTRELFSVPALVLSLARKYIPQNIYGIAEAIFNK